MTKFASKIKVFKFKKGEQKWIYLLLLIVIGGCNPLIEESVWKADLNKDVELLTDYGPIILRLSDETPKNRNNFIRQVNQNHLDSLFFYRVINKFLIQTGKDMPSDEPQLIDAEFQPNLYHRRGAVNAARANDDENPEQGSANLHFTIIQGKTYTDSTLIIAEKRINNWLAYNRVIHKQENKALFEKLRIYMIFEQQIREGNTKIIIGDFLAYNKIDNSSENVKFIETLQEIRNVGSIKDSIIQLKNTLNLMQEKELTTMKYYKIPEEHRQVYKTIGGAAHLDQNYTVFGSVVKGMDIVDKIAGVNTNEQDTPLKDIMIIKTKLIKREKYD